MDKTNLGKVWQNWVNAPVEGTRPLSDEFLKCTVCGAPFIFSVSEQKWFLKKRMPEPIRCPACREINKRARAEKHKDS
jgi:putative zinc ribbon protein